MEIKTYLSCNFCSVVGRETSHKISGKKGILAASFLQALCCNVVKLGGIILGGDCSFLSTLYKPKQVFPVVFDEVEVCVPEELFEGYIERVFRVLSKFVLIKADYLVLNGGVIVVI